MLDPKREGCTDKPDQPPNHGGERCPPTTDLHPEDPAPSNDGGHRFGPGMEVTRDVPRPETDVGHHLGQRHSAAVPEVAAGIIVGLVIDVLRRHRGLDDREQQQQHLPHQAQALMHGGLPQDFLQQQEQA